MAALCLIQVTPGGLFENELKMILADTHFLDIAGLSYDKGCNCFLQDFIENTLRQMAKIIFKLLFKRY